MAQPGDLWWPGSFADFAGHRPSESQWAAELASGWRGSDGSTLSLDQIEGIEIGRTGSEYLPDLPANLHDFLYRVIRRLMAHRLIDEQARARLQACADNRLHAGMLSRVHVLIGLDGWVARRRAGVRFQAVRWRGRRHTLPTGGEAYRDLRLETPG